MVVLCCNNRSKLWHSECILKFIPKIIYEDTLQKHDMKRRDSSRIQRSQSFFKIPQVRPNRGGAGGRGGIGGRGGTGGRRHRNNPSNERCRLPI
jgi:hypothetical protein